tara:strand:- start:286 stop:645 length:360 start_codon:yes stop_codon:yes gene_type:complete
MHRTKLLQIIQELRGQIFNVCWVKKNGDERCANVRLGVTKHLKGGKSPANASNSFIPVFLMWNMDGNTFRSESGYRMLNLNTIRSINGTRVTPDPIFNEIDLTTTTTKEQPNNLIAISA